ncbi:MAG: hypothetical protein LBS33_08750 [Streptococcaceae bacterium]|jgi:hypothetical protein|nr:hypothetical protein [Streptococcaceae bacterium]
MDYFTYTPGEVLMELHADYEVPGRYDPKAFQEWSSDWNIERLKLEHLRQSTAKEILEELPEKAGYYLSLDGEIGIFQEENGKVVQMTGPMAHNLLVLHDVTNQNEFTCNDLKTYANQRYVVTAELVNTDPESKRAHQKEASETIMINRKAAEEVEIKNESVMQEKEELYTIVIQSTTNESSGNEVYLFSQETPVSEAFKTAQNSYLELYPEVAQYYQKTINADEWNVMTLDERFEALRDEMLEDRNLDVAVYGVTDMTASKHLDQTLDKGKTL